MACASAFAGAKLESLLVSNAASSPMSAFPASARVRRAALSRRGCGMIRCEAAPEAPAQVGSVEPTNAASLSALEQLKNSAVDRYTKERSSIAVIGLSIHTAPVEMREKLAIPEAEWPRAISEAMWFESY